MPCFLVLLALALPRLTIALLWFFSNWFHGLFDSILWPILGFVFLPTTFLWYTACSTGSVVPGRSGPSSESSSRC